MTLETYEDALGETVELLLSHNEHTGPVTQHLLDRLHRDAALQKILLGRELPADENEANALMRGRGVSAVHGLVSRAGKRIRDGYRGG